MFFGENKAHVKRILISKGKAKQADFYQTDANDVFISMFDDKKMKTVIGLYGYRTHKTKQNQQS